MNPHDIPNVGHGPARAACLDAIAAFRLGIERVGAPGWADWCERPHGHISVEGVGAGCVLSGRSLPRLPPPFVPLLELGAGMGRAIADVVEPRGRAPDAGWQADGYAFAMALLRPDAALGRRAPVADRAAWEHGLGRALWYLEAGEPTRIARLARGRSAHVWRGIGAASVFTGGSTPDGLAALAGLAGAHVDAFSSGAERATRLRGSLLPDRA